MRQCYDVTPLCYILPSIHVHNSVCSSVLSPSFVQVWTGLNVSLLPLPMFPFILKLQHNFHFLYHYPAKYPSSFLPFSSPHTKPLQESHNKTFLSRWVLCVLLYSDLMYTGCYSQARTIATTHTSKVTNSFMYYIFSTILFYITLLMRLKNMAKTKY